jgi:serine/threonine protein kinase
MEPLRWTDPSRIGEFTIGGRLGAGGMGRVYLGTNGSGRKVAVKVVHEQVAGSSEFRARFRREVAAAARVSGGHTAEVVAADPDADRPWMATAYVEGPTLADQVRRHGPLPADRLWRLARDVARALDAIHAAGVVHGDLKPSNVLLPPDGAKVIDFGVARAAETPAVTRTGSVVGTAAFMSPEHATGEPVRGSSDVFSLGSLLHYAATGRMLFAGRDATTQMYRVVHARPDLSALTDPLLRDLVARCLAKHPDRRPTPADVIARCDQVLRPPAEDRSGEPLGRTAQPPVTAARDVARRRALLAGGVLFGAVVVSLLALRGGAPAPAAPAGRVTSVSASPADQGSPTSPAASSGPSR